MNQSPLRVNKNPFKKCIKIPNRMALVLLMISCLWFVLPAYTYTIKGNLKNIKNCWYPKVYLAAIPAIDEMYTASYLNILQSASVDSAGNFELSGNDLPNEILFYRLYVTPTENINSQITTGVKRNYMLLALHNQSKIWLSTPNFCAPYFDYTIGGSPENSAIQLMQQRLDYFQLHYTDTASAVKKEFLEQRLLEDLLTFSDTSAFLHAALFALLETDVNIHFAELRKHYETFAEKYAATFPKSIYTKQIQDKLLVLSLKEDVQNGRTNLRYIYILLAVLAISVVGNIYQLTRTKEIKHSSSEENKEVNAQLLIKDLTIKEREILLLIDQGLSNKEIADKLNVEVSTIKTHVSRIYQKVNIKNRKEVREIAKHLS